MLRFNVSKIFPGLCVTVALVSTCLSGQVLADGPAAVAPIEEPAKVSFNKFAQSWMDKVQRLAADEKQKPTVRPGAANTIVTYREYADEFDVELRPTGHAAAPYVGILRYSEQVFSCRNIAANDCTLTSQSPVMEIFRYQDGRWVY